MSFIGSSVLYDSITKCWDFSFRACQNNLDFYRAVHGLPRHSNCADLMDALRSSVQPNCDKTGYGEFIYVVIFFA